MISDGWRLSSLNGVFTPRLSVGTSKGLLVVNVGTNTVVSGERTPLGELYTDEMYFILCLLLIPDMLKHVLNVWPTFPHYLCSITFCEL